MNYSFYNVEILDRSYIKILLLLTSFIWHRELLTKANTWSGLLLSSWALNVCLNRLVSVVSFIPHSHLVCSSAVWQPAGNEHPISLSPVQLWFLESSFYTFTKSNHLEGHFSDTSVGEGTLICSIESDNIKAVVHLEGVYSHKMSSVTVSSHGWRFELLNQNPDYIDKDDNVDLRYTCAHKHTHEK